MTYSYSSDEEHYTGNFNTIEDACRAGASEVCAGGHFWVGICVPPPSPETMWNANDWRADIADCDEYHGDWAAEWFDSMDCVTLTEFQSAVRVFMRQWLQEHDLLPKFFNVEQARKYIATVNGGYEQTP
jgi:hypothetical protein